MANKKSIVAEKTTSPKRSSAFKRKLTKSQITSMIASETDLTKKQVSEVIASMESLIERSLRKNGCGEFTMPGMMKITTIKKPARKARTGINPFTGEETVFKPKPASVGVRIRALKKMKDFAS